MSDIEIITLVEKNPILWDSRLKDFKNKTKQRVVWMMLAEKLNLTVEYIMHRWICIRRQYVRKNKPIPSGSGTDELYQWNLYKYMMFLAPVVRHRRTINNAPQQNMTDTDENFESPDYENISINIQSQPSCSRSISPFHTPPYDNTNINTSNITHNTSTIQDYNFHSTTADDDSSNKNNSTYDKIHINTEELEFDDDDTDDAPFTQCTQTTYNSDIASTQDSHYNTNIPQRRQPLLLRVTPATSTETFSSVPFQSNDTTPLRHSNIHNQSCTFTQQTPRQQQFPRRRLQTPRQRQQIPRRQLQTPRQQQQQHIPKPQNTARNNKRKLDDKLHNYLENTENYLLQKINNDIDEDLCFFKGTLSIIKEFSPDKKFRFKQEYMNLLTTFKNETV